MWKIYIIGIIHGFCFTLINIGGFEKILPFLMGLVTSTLLSSAPCLSSTEIAFGKCDFCLYSLFLAIILSSSLHCLCIYKAIYNIYLCTILSHHFTRFVDPNFNHYDIVFHSFIFPLGKQLTSFHLLPNSGKHIGWFDLILDFLYKLRCWGYFHSRNFILAKKMSQSILERRQ